MYRIQKEGPRLVVLDQNETAAEFEWYENPVHNQNFYIRIKHLPATDKECRSLFSAIYAYVGRPLQIMSASDDPLAGILLSNGFRCVRKCFEVEGDSASYVGGASSVPLHRANRGETDYQVCCEHMYKHYQSVHAAVNPLSAAPDVFEQALPDLVLYQTEQNRVIHLAFVEENEIAYVCSSDLTSFSDFASVLITSLLETYETVCFECDDCDPPSMQLRKLFIDQCDTSFDTFLFP